MCLQHIRDPNHSSDVSAKMAEEIITREDARARGLRHFFTGLECPAGHISKRITARGSCVTCYALKEAERRAKNKNKRNDSFKIWRSKNLEYLAAYRKEYLARNRERNKKTCKEYQEKNRDRVKQMRKAWRSNNIEIERNYSRQRRALLSGSYGSHTIKELKDILILQKNKCANSCCRVRFGKNIAPTLDHIIPLSRGGSNERSNLQYLCRSCNSAKKNHDPIDFARRQGMLL